MNLKPLPDPMAPPMIPDLPEEPRAAKWAWSQVHRENAYLRRNIHRLQRKIDKGKEPAPFRTCPHYAKLGYRPIILGLAPTLYARSTIAWDDPDGDMLAGRFGMHGFMQLMANFKLRNVYTYPVQDLPLEYQGSARKAEALAKLVDSGVFQGRVVIVAGNEVRQLAGLNCDRDHIGPVSQSLGGSRLLISMVEPRKSRKWMTEAGRREALQLAVLALLAARLPSADPIADAFALARGEDVPSWQAVGGSTGEAFADLMEQSSAEIWHALCRVGIAAPVDLANGLWFEPARNMLEACFTGGVARLTFDQEIRAVGGEYAHGKLLGTDGRLVFETRGRKPHVVRQQVLDEVIRLGWEYPFVALDRRLADLHGATSRSPR